MTDGPYRISKSNYFKIKTAGMGQPFPWTLGAETRWAWTVECDLPDADYFHVLCIDERHAENVASSLNTYSQIARKAGYTPEEEEEAVGEEW